MHVVVPKSVIGPFCEHDMLLEIARRVRDGWITEECGDRRGREG